MSETANDGSIPVSVCCVLFLFRVIHFSSGVFQSTHVKLNFFVVERKSLFSCAELSNYTSLNGKLR